MSTEYDLLNERLEYRDGKLYHKNPRRKAYKGREASASCNTVNIGDRAFCKTTAIWILNHKKPPNGLIYFIDGDNTNTRIENMYDTGLPGSKRKRRSNIGIKRPNARKKTEQSIRAEAIYKQDLQDYNKVIEDISKLKDSGVCVFDSILHACEKHDMNEHIEEIWQVLPEDLQQQARQI